VIDVALLTFREMSRRRFFLGATVATAALIAVTGWGFWYLSNIHAAHGRPVTHLEVLSMSAVLVILISYLFNFLLAVAAVFLAAPSLANDIESGVLLPVLARPISRGAIFSGKALALSIVIVLYAFVTGACEFAVIHAATGYVPPHPAQALGFLALSGLVMVALALLLGTRMPAIAASIVSVGLFIIARLGSAAQSLGLHFDNATATHAGTLSQLLLPSDAMWQAALFRLEPESMIAELSNAHTWVGPFFTTAAPPAAMVAWSLAWIAVIAIFAARAFELRDF
jgi:ABC-type transport system involved in multi-copper enzyme maturation permease subunit